MEEKEKNIKAVQKVLGEPVICEFDAKTQKIRTTLFILSVISIAYTLGGLKIEAGSSFLGLKFSGLNNELFHYILLGSVAYLAMHFVWCAVDSFMEWRLRITGTKVAFVTAAIAASSHGDYPNDPRQSTLYNWWKEKMNSISGIDENIVEINRTFEAVNTEIELLRDEGQTLNINNVIQSLTHIRGEVINLRGKIEEINNILEANRVPASLDRFDN
ncbi:MAG: hypothetical protein E2O86_07425 [Bacteroidetes bacterium]|nr:MAG: hypothetical protein E2O86_07425 [Bacteroidota bacterium]